MNAVFALFPNETRARRAIKEVMDRDELSPDIDGIITHATRDGGRFRARELVETDAGPALRRGLVVGIIGGALFGAALGGPLGLVSGGPGAGALLGAVLGSVFSVFGAIAGAGRLDASLRRLASTVKRGQMLVTFKVGHRETERAIERIVRRFGAVPVTKGPGG